MITTENIELDSVLRHLKELSNWMYQRAGSVPLNELQSVLEGKSTELDETIRILELNLVAKEKENE